MIWEVIRVANTKKNRLSIRIGQKDKETLGLAAFSKRVSLSSYILSAAMEKAKNDLERERRIALSRSAWNQAMDLVDNPPEPNEALMRLLRQ